VNLSTLTISMIADNHDLILDITRDNTHDVPDGRNFVIDYEDDGQNEYAGDEENSTMIDEPDRPVLTLNSLQ